MTLRIMLNLITLMSLKICWDTYLNFWTLFWEDGTRQHKVVYKTFCLHSAVKKKFMNSKLPNCSILKPRSHILVHKKNQPEDFTIRRCPKLGSKRKFPLVMNNASMRREELQLQTWRTGEKLHL